jgi:predicted phosphoadenosine phosphosulfate sulfurtransferase
MKVGIGKDVLTASIERISYTFDCFEKLYVSFSGGKDSGVMLHLVAEEARNRGRKIGVLIVDLEAQYKMTIDFIETMVSEYKDVIDLYWVALPIALRNAVSVYEPKWKCWDSDARSIWVRQQNEKMITDPKFFDFFQDGMEFEDFVPKFGYWYSQGKPCACFVGIRSDESLNRYRTIASDKKETFAGKQWTTRVCKSQWLYNVYPIYDWRTEDIWVFHNKTGLTYNKLYDIMHQAGLSVHQQRICQPYGDDQRKGLYLYHVIEPESWAKIVARVSGANSGAEFVQLPGNASGTIRISKPDNHTWQSYSEVILNSMPKEMKEHYQAKIHTFLRWYEERGYRNGIPDAAEPKEEAKRTAPSWRRIAKMLLRNDYWAKGLSFSQTKHGYHYQRYLERKKKERQQITGDLRCKNG